MFPKWSEVFPKRSKVFPKRSKADRVLIPERPFALVSLCQGLKPRMIHQALATYGVRDRT